jgi:CBS domain containing-hemolysin-like protein
MGPVCHAVVVYNASDVFELILAVVVMLLLSAVSSGSEAALFAVPYGQVLSFDEEGRRGAGSLKRIKDRMARPIMAIVVANNMANIVGSILVGAMAAELLSSRYLGLFSAGLTLLVIVYSEIIPKTLGEKYAGTIALMVAPPILTMSWVLTPVLAVIELLVRPVAGSPSARGTSEEEIRALTQFGGTSGVIEADEQQLIQRVFRLNDIQARDIMTPIARADVLDGGLPLEELRHELAELTHSRLPVYEKSIDQIKGVVHIRDLLQALADSRTDLTATALANEAEFIPAVMAGDDLLEHFRDTRNHLACVVDEHGTVLGVVTLEDVLEELVGEIEDETDVVLAELKKVAADTVVCQPAVTTGRINEALGTSLPSGTLSELLIEVAQRIPQAGEVVAVGEVDVEVLQATPRVVERVRVVLRASTS